MIKLLKLFKPLRGVLVAGFSQSIIGHSPEPPVPTWEALAGAIDWDGPIGSKLAPDELTAYRQLKIDRLLKAFDDETHLMTVSFNKLMSLVTALALLLAFGGSLKPAPAFVLVALMIVIWALSPRLKLFGFVSDAGLEALRPNGLDGTVWYYYTWMWHRRRTRVAIERLYVGTSILTVVGLGWKLSLIVLT